MQPEVTLRELRPDDGAKLAALGEQTPDTGAVAFHNTYLFDPYETTMALHHNAVGVVAESPDFDGIVGMGMMSTGDCQYEGELRPFAYLFGLSVHPDYRQRGLAARISQWRMERARTLYGSDVVLFAGIQQGNEGSLRNAAKWSTQRIEGRTAAGVTKMRSSPPKLVAGLLVRPADLADYEEIAQKQNQFYAEYNLYPPRSAQALFEWNNAMPYDQPVRQYYVVVEDSAKIVGGLSATSEGYLTVGNVVRMPWTLRILNSFIRVLPADGVTKRVHIKDLWFEPERMEAGSFLWESVRWLQREAGTMMMCFYDTQGRFAEIIQPPSYMPPLVGTLVITGPKPMESERLIYVHT